MRSLLLYLNSLEPEARARFVASCGTSEGYLRKASSVGALLREKLCTRIERYSDGAVSRKALRPDDWQEIWPELADPKENPAPAASAGQATETINPEAAEGAHA